MPLDVASAILQRRATKVFDPDHRMTDAELDTLLGLARRMPTAFNIQNWRFVAVTDPELRTKIRAVAWIKLRLLTLPCFWFSALTSRRGRNPPRATGKTPPPKCSNS